MDLGANFPAKLEPFLLMAKSAKGAAAAKLVQDATAAPGVYVFSELLAQPSIQEASTWMLAFESGLHLNVHCSWGRVNNTNPICLSSSCSRTRRIRTTFVCTPCIAMARKIYSPGAEYRIPRSTTAAQRGPDCQAQTSIYRVSGNRTPGEHP